MSLEKSYANLQDSRKISPRTAKWEEHRALCLTIKQPGGYISKTRALIYEPAKVGDLRYCRHGVLQRIVQRNKLDGMRWENMDWLSNPILYFRAKRLIEVFRNGA